LPRRPVNGVAQLPPATKVDVAHAEVGPSRDSQRVTEAEQHPLIDVVEDSRHQTPSLLAALRRTAPGRRPEGPESDSPRHIWTWGFRFSRFAGQTMDVHYAAGEPE